MKDILSAPEEQLKKVGRSEMYIVKAETNQVNQVVDMSIRAFETDVNVGGVKGECPSVEWHKQMAREGHLYLAMIGIDLVGAAVIFPDKTKNRVYIGRIFIDSCYHRKGYGISLMECIEKNFPFADEFDLDTPCWNERTNAFYKKLGYRIIKTVDGFVYYRKRKSEHNIIQNIS
ncbi:MAG: GNAT family N-acetyltransferase [Ruminococcus sp.]|nr:GNAT family N-acetyltransferase [Ruminococcus sp.]